MEVRSRFVTVCAAACACLFLGAGARTANFIVEAPTPQFAVQVAREAERFRSELAIEWLGRELPPWREPCPIFLQVGDKLGAGGATSFSFLHGEVMGWKMTIQGSAERILDSVLPHEVNHTIFATHFRCPLPRWADEGACTLTEHPEERAKQQQMLIVFLKSNRGIAFAQMFAMREYPDDIMPLYSQGYSLTRFLVHRGGRRKFVDFVGEGLQTRDWAGAIRNRYGFEHLGALQDAWLEWVKRGSPLEPAPNGLLVAAAPPAAGQAGAGLPQAAGQAGAGLPVPERAESADPVAAQFAVAAQAAAREPQPLFPAGVNAPAARADQHSAVGPGVRTVASSRDAQGWTAVGGRYRPAPPVPVAVEPPPASPSPIRELSRPQPTEAVRQTVLEWSRDQRDPPAPDRPPFADGRPVDDLPLRR